MQEKFHIFWQRKGKKCTKRIFLCANQLWRKSIFFFPLFAWTQENFMQFSFIFYDEQLKVFFSFQLMSGNYEHLEQNHQLIFNLRLCKTEWLSKQVKFLILYLRIIISKLLVQISLNKYCWSFNAFFLQIISVAFN